MVRFRRRRTAPAAMETGREDRANPGGRKKPLGFLRWDARFRKRRAGSTCFFPPPFRLCRSSADRRGGFVVAAVERSFNAPDERSEFDSNRSNPGGSIFFLLQHHDRRGHRELNRSRIRRRCDCFCCCCCRSFVLCCMLSARIGRRLAVGGEVDGSARPTIHRKNAFERLSRFRRKEAGLLLSGADE